MKKIKLSLLILIPLIAVIIIFFLNIETKKEAIPKMVSNEHTVKVQTVIDTTTTNVLDEAEINITPDTNINKKLSPEQIKVRDMFEKTIPDQPKKSLSKVLTAAEIGARFEATITN